MKHPISCLIIDDERPARELLTDYIQKIPSLSLIDKCANPLRALEFIQMRPIDLIFLDIEMPHLNGIEFLQTLQIRPLVIFTTGYSNYAIKSYEFDTVDYLLKPFGFERFVQAVNRAKTRLRQAVNTGGNGLDLHPTPVAAAAYKMHEQHGGSRDYILVKSEHKVYKIKYSQIQYIQSMKEYVSFKLASGRILSLRSLKGLEEELPGSQFVRIHRSYIVSVEKIVALEGNRVQVGTEKLPIGVSYRNRVVGRFF